MFILELCQQLEKHQCNYAIVGGYAVALHGAVRGTVDIDLVIAWEIDQLRRIESCLQAMGLVAKLPIDAENLFAFRDEYINNRNLIAWNFYHPADISKQIDVIINYDLKQQKVIEKHIDLQTIKILNRQDLIKMKQASNRPQDLEDIKALQHIK